MSWFGNKEPWMDPMNSFIADHRNQFKRFVDDICNVPVDELDQSSPSYVTPLSVFHRLHVDSREGFPSLPYLIDRTRDLAGLVNLWLDNVNAPANGEASDTPTLGPPSGDLARFHSLCLGLRQRTQTCTSRADTTEKIPSALSHKWVKVAEQMEVNPSKFWVRRGGSSTPRKSPGDSAESVEEMPFRMRTGSLPVAPAHVLSGEPGPSQENPFEHEKSYGRLQPIDTPHNERRASATTTSPSAQRTSPNEYLESPHSKRSFFSRKSKSSKVGCM